MRTGRPRTPQSKKILLGTTRDDRQATREWNPAPGKPACPKHLSAIAKKEFRRLCSELREVLTKLDTGVLAAYCACYADWIEASGKVTADGAVCISEKGGQYQSPWVAIRNKSLEQLHKFGNELGLSPVARTRVKTAAKGIKTDDFEAFLNRSKRA